LSAIIVDRSLAAIGEVCWVVQISLAIEEIASFFQERRRPAFDTTVVSEQASLQLRSRKRRCRNCCWELATVLMVLLAVAGEVCSFLGTATTNAFYEVLEASCWFSLFAVGALCGLVLLIKICRQHFVGNNSAKRFTCAMMLTGVTYCPYMLLSNIPMYYHRWQDDQAHHKKYLPILEGLKDAATHRIPTSKWSAWKDDWFWMSFYFSFAVWSSILLMYAPRLNRHGSGIPGLEFPSVESNRGSTMRSSVLP